MDVLREIYARARETDASVVLPESEDPRVLEAAATAVRDGIARPILIGDPRRTRPLATRAGVPADIPILAPADDPGLGAMTRDLAADLTRRGIEYGSDEDLARWVEEPLVYADLLVRHGRADGAVMGAVATTSETLRAALRVLGVAKGRRVVTSCFLMLLPDGRALTYADCGVIPAPTARQLADIAEQAADSHRLLTGETPRVALLAFSTKGSAEHPSLRNVREAVSILASKEAAGDITFSFDGELQADAALVPTVGAGKAPDSAVAGRANVLVFPDLNSGNIAYKLTERLAGARALGPLIRGLAHPVHDLSRGCSSSDVLDVIAIAALEAETRRNHESTGRGFGRA